MPADFSQYVDLTPFDAEPGDIYVDSIEFGRLVLPEFNLRVGTPEDAIFQAMAYITALNISAINRLPNGLMEGIMNLLGVGKQGAVPAEVDVIITLDNYQGGTVPAGTIFSYETTFEDEIQEYVFQTATAVNIPEVIDPDEDSELPSASVTAVSITAGVIPPITTPGTRLNVLSSGTNILTVETLANFSNGVNADEDSDYLSRASTYLRSLTSALNKSAQLDSYVLTNYSEKIGRAKSYDLTYGDQDLGDITVSRSSSVVTTFLNSNVATVETDSNHLFVVGDEVKIEDCGASFDGTRTVTATSDTTFSFVSVNSNSASTSVDGKASAGIDNPGYVTLFVYGINTFLTQDEKEEILVDISNKSVAGLSISVRDPEIASLSVNANLIIDQSYDQAVLQESIEDALAEYLNPNYFPYSDNRVRRTKLITIVNNIPGVVHVEDLDISPISGGWLPQHGADLLFLNKGTLPIVAAEDIVISYSLANI